MKRWTALALVSIVLLMSLVASASGTSIFGTRFKVGTEIQFQVQDETIWWWGCCSCTPSQVLGWRVTTSAGVVVYSVVHDAPVPAATWIGKWSQTDANGKAVATGQYVLYVDTSAGTLSRCFSLYDPCACSTCYWGCWTCRCQEVPSITQCACRTSLEFVDTCGCGGLPLFGWLGCGCGCTTCSSCSGHP